MMQYTFHAEFFYCPNVFLFLRKLMLVQHMLQCVDQMFSSKLLVTLIIDFKICVMSEILCANGSDYESSCFL